MIAATFAATMARCIRRAGAPLTMRAVALCTMVFAASSSLLSAQGGPPVVPPGGVPGMNPMGGGLRGMRPDDPRRAELEKRFQERIDAIVKQRLSLTDEQATKLREVATRTEEGRRALRRDEMGVRFAMRRELLAGDRVNEARVAELLDQMPKLDRRRLELQEQEQRELAKFLTAVQRARYFALQEELRRGMQDLQQRRMGFPGDTSHQRRPPGYDNDGRKDDGRKTDYRRRGG